MFRCVLLILVFSSCAPEQKTVILENFSKREIHDVSIYIFDENGMSSRAYSSRGWFCDGAEGAMLKPSEICNWSFYAKRGEFSKNDFSKVKVWFERGEGAKSLEKLGRIGEKTKVIISDYDVVISS